MNYGLKAKVSVVIPVKDRVDDLHIAVRSVLSQTVLPEEIIIVDDGSALPLTREILNATEAEATSIHIIRNETNIGAAASCNRGLAEARCAIVAFLDSDDAFSPTYIEEMTDAWGRPGHGFVCLASGFWWATNELLPYRKQTVTRTVDYDALLRNGNFVGGNSILSVDRKAALDVGGFPVVKGAYDWGFMLRLSRRGLIATLPKPLVIYRSPSASKLDNETKNVRRQVSSMFAILKEQPREHRYKANQFVHGFICVALANCARTRWGLRYLLAYVLRYGCDQLAVQCFLALLIGSKRFSQGMRGFALSRAMFLRTFSSSSRTANCPR